MTAQAMSEHPLMTEAEAARWLSVSPRTLRKLRHEGAVEFILIRTAIKYTLRDLQAYVESRRTCQSTVEKAPRTGGCRSASPGVLDFEALRAKRTNARRA